MKTLPRTFLPEIFTNSISRNLILIFLATLATAIFLVTAGFMLSDQW